MNASIAKGLTILAALTLLTACSSSSDAGANVASACKAWEDSGPETIDTVGPFLDEMVSQAEQAASADDSYREFADAAVVLRDTLTTVGQGPDDDVIARQDLMLEAGQIFEDFCSNASQ